MKLMVMIPAYDEEGRIISTYLSIVMAKLRCI